MNQALSYIMLVTVSILVVGPMIIFAQSNVANTVLSYHDFVELEKERASQDVSVTHIQHDDMNQEIHIHLVNTGLGDIEFEHVLIDGVPLAIDSTANTCWNPNVMAVKQTYCFYDIGGANYQNTTYSLAIDSGTRIGIEYDGTLIPNPELVQLVTDTFKLFEVDIPQ